jgi:hypothetical protein
MHVKLDYFPWGDKTKPGVKKDLASSRRVLADYYWKSFREKE